jgi:hypothetical protein
MLLAACGGGDELSIADFLHGQIRAACTRAFDCRSTYPGDDFDQVVGTSVDACVATFGPTDTTIAQYEMAFALGRIAYDPSVAQECIDLWYASSCDTFWVDIEVAGVCEQVLLGLVESGDHCDFTPECADLAQECVLGRCRLP